MSLNVKTFHRFLRTEDGAATVDYVMLTAAVAVVAVGASEVVLGGLGVLADTVTDELSGEADSEMVEGLRYADGFDNGSAGWFGAVATRVDGLGNVLGPIENTGGGAGVTREFAIDPNAGAATFSFDLYSMDDFDGDNGIIFINDVEIGRVTVDHGVATFTRPVGYDDEEIAISFGAIDEAVHLGGNPNEVDGMGQISVTVNNPTEFVTFGFGSDASAGSDNEFFAIDNFVATGLLDPGSV